MTRAPHRRRVTLGMRARCSDEPAEQLAGGRSEDELSPEALELCQRSGLKPDELRRAIATDPTRHR